jgi:hypothetical protein
MCGDCARQAHNAPLDHGDLRMLTFAGTPRLRLTTLLTVALLGLSFNATAAPTEPTHASAPAGADVQAAKADQKAAKRIQRAKAEHRKAHKAVKRAPKARRGV